MPREHRYTGEFPPIEVIARFANWDYALDEEGESGQDETTIRPEADSRMPPVHLRGSRNGTRTAVVSMPVIRKKAVH